MSREEEKAFHRGKLAAFLDEKHRGEGRLRRCEFRQADLVKAWKAGYAEQCATAAAARVRTAEEEARVAGFVSAIDEWLARQK
jgi:hypothetical protein